MYSSGADGESESEPENCGVGGASSSIRAAETAAAHLMAVLKALSFTITQHLLAIKRQIKVRRAAEEGGAPPPPPARGAARRAAGVLARGCCRCERSCNRAGDGTGHHSATTPGPGFGGAARVSCGCALNRTVTGSGSGSASACTCRAARAARVPVRSGRLVPGGVPLAPRTRCTWRGGCSRPHLTLRQPSHPVTDCNAAGSHCSFPASDDCATR